jgi:hypothetical protein
MLMPLSGVPMLSGFVALLHFFRAARVRSPSSRRDADGNLVSLRRNDPPLAFV